HEFACKSDEEAQRIRAGFLPAEPSTPAPEGEAAPGSGAEATVPDAANGQDASSAEAGDPATGSDSDKGKIHTSTFYLGLHLIKRERSATGERRMDLSLPTQDFIRRIKDSDVWKGDDEMAISIRFLRQEQLPDEVFAGMSRERLRTSSSTRQDKKKSKKRSTQGADDAAASEAPAKKAKLAAAPVPSTSGFAADAGSKQASDEAAGRNMVTSAEGGSSATANGSTKPATSVVSIPAPVPPMAKSGGIKLKLLGS
ncbi:polynucleotide adenylyltransferase, partial [Coemansia sp. RSA 2702]